MSEHQAPDLSTYRDGLPPPRPLEELAKDAAGPETPAQYAGRLDQLAEAYPLGDLATHPAWLAELAQAKSRADGMLALEQARALAPSPRAAAAIVPPPNPTLEPSSNTDGSGVNHFLMNVDGRELCGGCGETFPCDAWRELHTVPSGVEALRGFSGQLTQADLEDDRVARAAALLGVTPEEMDTMLQRRNDAGR